MLVIGGLGGLRNGWQPQQNGEIKPLLPVFLEFLGGRRQGNHERRENKTRRGGTATAGIMGRQSLCRLVQLAREADRIMARQN